MKLAMVKGKKYCFTVGLGISFVADHRGNI